MPLISEKEKHTILLFGNVSNIKKDFSSASSETHPNPKPVQSANERKIIASMITVYFKYAYHCGLAPFMIGNTYGEPRIITWWVPKVVWLISLVPSIILRIAESRLSVADFSSEWNPAKYFRMFHGFFKIIFHLVLWYYIWFKAEKFLDVVWFIYKRDTLPIPKLNLPGKILPPLLCVITLVIGLTVGTTNSGVLISCTYNSMEDMDKLVIFWREWGKYALLLNEKPIQCEEIGISKSLTGFDYAFGIASGIGCMFRQANGAYEELFLLFGVYVFWLTSQEFSRRLNGMQSKELMSATNLGEDFRTPSLQDLWDSVVSSYSSLKCLSVLIKGAYAEILLYRLLLMIFDLPIHLGTLGNTLDMARFAANFLPNALILILAADSAKNIKSLEAWLSTMVEDGSPGVSHYRLSMVLHELQNNTVGISAGQGFTITYSLVASVTGILITYFIICVQYATP